MRAIVLGSILLAYAGHFQAFAECSAEEGCSSEVDGLELGLLQLKMDVEGKQSSKSSAVGHFSSKQVDKDVNDMGKDELAMAIPLAIQNLTNFSGLGTELQSPDIGQRMRIMKLLPIIVGLWILCAIVWQLRTNTETLPQTTCASSAIPGTSESAIDDSTTLQTQQSPTSTSSRDTAIDEVKFHLMTLVVLLHLFEYGEQDHRMYCSTICDIVKIVHMPAFVMLSGMFSKSLMSQTRLGLRQDNLKNTCNLLGAFLVSGVVRNMMDRLVMMQSIGVNILLERMISAPPGPWYILALFWWRLVWCPISSVLDPRVRVPAAIFFAVGFVNNRIIAGGVHKVLACSSTFYFLPSFELGLHLSKDVLTHFSGSWTAFASLLVFFFVLPFLSLQTNVGHWISLLHEHYGDRFVLVAMYGVRVCLSMLAMGLLLRIAQIGITTKIGKAMHSMLAGFGRQSLYVYVLQRILLPCWTCYTDILSDMQEIVLIPLSLFLAVVLNIMLSTQFTKSMFWWMCEPSYLFSAIPPKSAEKTTRMDA